MKITKGDLTIEMNRLEVEEFFSGPEEWKVELRQSVAQSFSQRYLKGVLNSEAVQNLRAKCLHEVESVVRKELNDTSWGDRALPASKIDQIKTQVLQNVQSNVKSLVIDETNKAISESVSKIALEISNRVDTKINTDTETLIKAEVQRPLGSIAQAVQESFYSEAVQKRRSS